jgi:hypothetical protein
MGVRTKFEFLFWDSKVTYPPPFFKVLIVVVCLFFPNCSPFARYKGYQNFGGAK